MAPSNYLFILLYLMSFIVVFGFDNWFLIWLGLEINMLSFLLIMFKHNSMISLESCFKYFFVQSIGSGILMFIWYFGGYWSSYLTALILSLKLGAAPFYYWFPSVVDGLSWMGAFLLMSFQKILPLMIMSMIDSMMMWMILVLSLGVGSLGMFNQSKLKLILAYSSIHHLGWMMFIMKIKIMYWFVYLIMYAFLIYPMIVLFNKMQVFSLSEVSNMNKMDLVILGIMSLSGLPPFLGFYLKMWVFSYLTGFSFYLFFYMIIMSVLMCYVYMRMVYLILMMKNEGNLMMYSDVKMMSLMLMGYLFGSVFGFYMVM